MENEELPEVSGTQVAVAGALFIAALAVNYVAGFNFGQKLAIYAIRKSN